MRKNIAILLAIVLEITCFSGCGGAKTTETTTEVTTEAITETTTEATTETTTETTNETTTETGWKVGNKVDDFGDPTDDLYIYASFSGRFRNTATADEDLTVGVFFVPAFADPDKYAASFAFRLLEYNDHPATYVEDTEFILKVKIGDEIYEEKLYSFPPNGDLYIYNATTGLHSDILLKLVHELDDGNTVRCIIESENSKYEFEITSDGWKEAMAEIKEPYGVGKLT